MTTCNMATRVVQRFPSSSHTDITYRLLRLNGWNRILLLGYHGSGVWVFLGFPFRNVVMRE